MTISSSVMRSSMVISFVSSDISVLLSSPYFDFTSRSSSLIIFETRSSLPSIAFNRSISFKVSLYSLMIFSLSSPVSLWSFMSRMACAWTSERGYLDINPCFASSGLFEALIRAMISSRWSRAIFSPSRIWALSSAFLSSYRVLLRTTSRLCRRK